MRLRPFILNRDFDTVKSWSTDGRTHAMWCAGRFDFPLEKENFAQTLDEMLDLHGDYPHSK